MKNKPLSFEQACEILNISPALPDVSNVAEDFQKPMIAHYKLMVIIQATNGKDYKHDWNSSSVRKYEPYFQMYDQPGKPLGSGFSLFLVDFCHGLSTVGSRLCFRERDAAEAAVTEHIGLYKDLMF